MAARWPFVNGPGYIVEHLLPVLMEYAARQDVVKPIDPIPWGILILAMQLDADGADIVAWNAWNLEREGKVVNNWHKKKETDENVDS